MRLSPMPLAVALALAPVAATGSSKCTLGQLENVVTILSTSSKDRVQACQASSGGFSIFPPAATPPTDDQVMSMCASTDCLKLTNDLMHAGLADCTVDWNGKTFNPHEMASGFLAICGLLEADTSSGSASEESVVGDEPSSAKSAVLVGIIETYRPNWSHTEHHPSSPPPPPCATDAYPSTKYDDAKDVAPAVTDESAPAYAKHDKHYPTPAYTKHETYHPTPAPSYTEHDEYHETPKPSYVQHSYGTSRRPQDGHAWSPKPDSGDYSAPEPADGSYEPEKTQPGHYTTLKPVYSSHATPKPHARYDETHKPSHHWFERETSEAISYTGDSDYTPPADDELVESTDYESDRDDSVKVDDSDYESAGKH